MSLTHHLRPLHLFQKLTTTTTSPIANCQSPIAPFTPHSPPRPDQETTNMKLLTAEEERAHYRATVQGGIVGGLAGATLATGAVALSHRRSPFFRALPLPLKAFLVTSGGTFATIISADRASHNFERTRRPEDAQYGDRAQDALSRARAGQGPGQRALAWASERKYWILAGSWAASMGGSWMLVRRDRYLTYAQKLVQARVWAQGFTVLAMVATAALEIGQARRGEGKYRTITEVDPDDPEHRRLREKRVHVEEYGGQDQWKDMVETEERRLKRVEEEEREVAERDRREKRGRGKAREVVREHKGKVQVAGEHEKDEKGGKDQTEEKGEQKKEHKPKAS